MTKRLVIIINYIVNFTLRAYQADHKTLYRHGMLTQQTPYKTYKI